MSKQQTVGKKIQSILDVANISYAEGEGQINQSEEQIGHYRGDGLAEFLRNEIIETCKGNAEAEMVDIAAHAVEVAIEELRGVHAAILNMG